MRTPMVTRTITTTIASVLCINTVTNEVTEISVTLPRTYKDNEDIMKYIKKNDVDFGDFTPVTVKSSEVKEDLYGMTEEKFISLADKITKKQAEDAEANQADDTPAEAPAPKKPKKNA